MCCLISIILLAFVTTSMSMTYSNWSFYRHCRYVFLSIAFLVNACRHHQHLSSTTHMLQCRIFQCNFHWLSWNIHISKAVKLIAREYASFVMYYSDTQNLEIFILVYILYFMMWRQSFMPNDSLWQSKSVLSIEQVFLPVAIIQTR